MARSARSDATPASALSPAIGFWLLVGLVAVNHVSAGFAPGGFITSGLLPDPDSWLRMQRVLDLWQGAGWFEERTFRLNAPAGLSVHWTRPLDILILLPAQALSGALGLAQRDAVLLAGAWICPVLHACCAGAAVFAARAIWSGIGPLMAGLLVAANPVVGGYSVVGRADHHTLILLFALLALGAAMRAAARPAEHKAAWWAGAFAGMGVWVSPEALLVAAPVLAGFGVLWIAEGARGFPAGGAAVQGSRAALGFTLVVTAAVAVEHPPSSWLDGEYDKVSAQHALMGALGAGVFATAATVAGGVIRRVAVGGAAAAFAVGALLAFRPNALHASLAGVDADIAANYMPMVAEMQPVDLSLAGLLAETSVILAAAPAALLVLALAAPVLRREGTLAAAVPLGLALAVALPMTLLHRRFAVDLAAPACLLAAGLPGLALGLRRPELRTIAAFLSVAVVLGIPFLGSLGLANAEKAGATIVSEECGAAALEAWGQQRRPPEAARGTVPDPVLLASSVTVGPELVWRTPFRVVGALYHRGGESVADTMAFFAATDDAAARAVAARRQVSTVLLCTPWWTDKVAGAGSFVSRLRGGELPDWLAPVPLPGAPAGVRLFAVQPLPPPGTAPPGG